MTRCMTLERAQCLAKQRGLPVGEVVCSTRKICTGVDCTLFPADEQTIDDLGNKQVGGFIARLAAYAHSSNS